MRAPSLEQVQYMEAHAGDTKVPGIIATACITLPLVYIVVCLRLVSRRIRNVKPEANDWLIVIALAFFTAFSVGCLMTARYGMGKHLIMVRDPKALAIWILVAECSYAGSILTIKLSLLSLYSWMFPLPWMRKLSTLVALFIIAFIVAQVFAVIYQCVPIKALWDPNISAKCINFNAMTMATSVMNVTTDIVVLILPMRPVWGLQISRSQKWQLSAVFALGGSACIVSFFRLLYVKRFGSADATWDDVEVGELSQIECCTGIVASSLPACRPLLRHLKNKLITKRNKVNQRDILSISRTKQTEDYHMSDGNASRGNNTSTKSDLDDERLYIPLE